MNDGCPDPDDVSELAQALTAALAHLDLVADPDAHVRAAIDQLERARPLVRTLAQVASAWKENP